MREKKAPNPWWSPATLRPTTTIAKSSKFWRTGVYTYRSTTISRVRSLSGKEPTGSKFPAELRRAFPRVESVPNLRAVYSNRRSTTSLKNFITSATISTVLDGKFSGEFLPSRKLAKSGLVPHLSGCCSPPEGKTADWKFPQQPYRPNQITVGHGFPSVQKDRNRKKQRSGSHRPQVGRGLVVIKQTPVGSVSPVSRKRKQISTPLSGYHGSSNLPTQTKKPKLCLVGPTTFSAPLENSQVCFSVGI